jgi:uncharacterized membrane protein YkvA (DUF1232 family)
MATLRDRARRLKAETLRSISPPATGERRMAAADAAVVVALSPIDLILTRPVLGYLDDLILIPISASRAPALIRPK